MGIYKDIIVKAEYYTEFGLTCSRVALCVAEMEPGLPGCIVFTSNFNRLIPMVLPGINAQMGSLMVKENTRVVLVSVDWVVENFCNAYPLETFLISQIGYPRHGVEYFPEKPIPILGVIPKVLRRDRLRSYNVSVTDLDECFCGGWVSLTNDRNDVYWWY